MSHSLTKIWLHVVFSTHQRKPIISKSLEPFLFRHLSHLLKEMDCMPLAINGYHDHVHLLFLMNPVKSTAEVLKQLKGNSSHTINQLNISSERFSWQTGYAAFSVSESQIGRVKKYIDNQKEHHQEKTFQKEVEDFLMANGLTHDISP